MALNVDPVVGLKNATYNPTSKPASGNLGEVDFMKLIIAQMKNQNPLEPQKDSDFAAQMAQFESLNEMKTMATSMKSLQAVSELSSASGMVGKTIVGAQANATATTRNIVGRELYSTPYSGLSLAQQAAVNNDQRVRDAMADASNVGIEGGGKVDKVVVGSDGIPLLMVGHKVFDLFSVSEVS